MTNPRDPARHLRVDHLKKDLIRLSLRGGAATLAAQLVKLIAQTISVVLLARLLPPSAFGLVAMVAALFSLLELFKDLGLTTATIQRPDISQRDVSALFWINVGLGAVIVIGVYFLAPLVAAFYGHPELVDITIVLSAGILFGALTAQHLAILRRQMRLKLVAQAEAGSELLGIAVAIGSAALGAGYWALVAQRLTANISLCVIAWIASPWRPGRPSFDSRIARLVGFGGNVTGFNVVNLLARSLDQILIGWYWGSVTLGFYERAYKLLMVPINNLNAPLSAVAVPMLSRLADEPERYRRAYLTTLEKLAMLTMPGAAFLIATADWVVALLFGPGWEAAGTILSFLGVAALFQPAANTTGWLFVSQNRAGEMLRWGLIGSAITVMAVIAGLPLGAVGVAGAYALSGLFLRMPILLAMVGRRGPVTTADLYRTLGPSMAAAISVLLVLGGVREIGSGVIPGPVAGLILSILLAAATTAACFLAIPASRRSLRELRQVRDLMSSQGAGA